MPEEQGVGTHITLMEQGKVQKAWLEFLDPDVLRPRLISAAIYIAGYESLKDAIISHARDLYWNGFDKSGDKYDPKYHTKVLSRNPSPLYASLSWFKDEMNAIDDADIDAFNRVKECRNLLSHKLLSLIGSEGLPPDFEKCFDEMIRLLHKIELWWIKNVEIPCDPALDGQDIDEKSIMSGRAITLQLLCEIAFGDRFYYDRFAAQFGKSTNPA